MRNFIRNPMNWRRVFIPAALVVDYLVKASLIGGILGNLLFALARKNQLDLTIGIAVGSSQQIALFVAPVLVLISYVVAPKPMNLVFGNAGLVIIFLAVLITGIDCQRREVELVQGRPTPLRLQTHCSLLLLSA